MKFPPNPIVIFVTALLCQPHGVDHKWTNKWHNNLLILKITAFFHLYFKGFVFLNGVSLKNKQYEVFSKPISYNPFNTALKIFIAWYNNVPTTLFPVLVMYKIVEGEVPFCFRNLYCQLLTHDWQRCGILI